MKPTLRVVYAGPAHAHVSVHVGGRLREWRVSRGLTQEQAAVRAGLTRNTLAKHESSSMPDLKLSTMLALMELYGVGSLDDLIAPPSLSAVAAEWVAAGRPGLRGEFLG